jgi:hypothetical protein
MSITVYPNTGGDHAGFSHEGRSYVIDFARGPELKRLAAGTEPIPAIIDDALFVPGDTRLLVTSIEPGSDKETFVVYVDDFATDLALTRNEVATLAHAMPSGQ